MDFHLEKKIRLSNHKENKGLYSWCLQEIGDDGDQVGRDLIPWECSFRFTGSELRLNRGLKFVDFPKFADDEEERKETEFKYNETITINLHPGTCYDGKRLEDSPRFSMFGTDREITEFSLRITVTDDGQKENCRLWGSPSYTYENDFRYETTADTLQIYLELSKRKFEKLAALISNKAIDVLIVRIGNVSGFYSEWSPSISTDKVKVLTRGSEQHIEIPEGCEIDPPKLGDVGEFEFTLLTRSKLNPKQSFTALNISKLFEEEFEADQEDEMQVEASEDVNKLLSAQIARNQIELLKLKVPIWLITLFLGLMLLSQWL
jgi:hypothetical protein